MVGGPNLNDMLSVSEENWNGSENLEEYIGDMSGQHLERDLLREARKEEVDKSSEHKVYTKRPIAKCVKATGKQPIGSKWIDINQQGGQVVSKLSIKVVGEGNQEDSL